MNRRLATSLEWALVAIGVGCLGAFGYASLDARWFEQAQIAAFEVEQARASEHRRPAAPPAETSAVSHDSSPVEPGSLVGLLSIPSIDLSTAVVEGDDSSQLKRSAGHLPDTPWPWQEGNSAIAGHRDGRFRALQGIKVGDEVRLRTSRGELRYEVRELSIVDPDDLSVLDPRQRTSLTLITCYPFTFIGNAPRRFIVRAERVPG